jgi:cupin fold WbuC family metalloprotein
MLPVRRESDEILYANGDLIALSREDIAELKRLAAANPRRRCRICTHAGREDSLHEMLIVHAKDAWVAPHMHLGKDESVHVVEGMARLVTFNDDGEVTGTVELGGNAFYCRVPANTFHTLLIDSDWFVFHETTLGPFDRTRTKLATWAPIDEGPAAADFVARLRRRLRA